MALPTDRTSFKAWCLRELGDGAIEINVTDSQVEDRVDEALQYYGDYHFDATDKIYFKYQITQQDKDNKYITMPDNIIGVVQLFPISSSTVGQSMFDVRYQLALNDIWTFTGTSMVPFYMTYNRIQFIEQMLIGQQPIRFNRHVNRMYCDMDWNQLAVGEYIVAEAYQIIDPAIYPKVWTDRWLMKYATQLIKRQWGANLKKFSGMTMPGGLQFNGQAIYDEAVQEIAKMEEEMLNSYSLPASMMIG